MSKGGFRDVTACGLRLLKTMADGGTAKNASGACRKLRDAGYLVTVEAPTGDYWSSTRQQITDKGRELVAAAREAGL